MKKTLVLVLFMIGVNLTYGDDNINYYGQNDSINFIKGYGQIHFRGSEKVLESELYLDVYKDLILVKDKNSGIVNIYGPKDIDYIIVKSHYDSKKHILIAPMDLDIYDGFFSIRILGDVGFLGKLFVYDYVDIIGNLVYESDYVHLLLLGDDIIKFRFFWTVRKDLIKNLPKHQEKMREIYDKFDGRKIDKKNKDYDPQKVELVEFLLEEYNKIENEDYVNQIKKIRNNGF